MNAYYILHFRDGEKMDFGKRCESVDTVGGMVHFMTRYNVKYNVKVIAMVPMHAIRMIELVEEDV